MDSKADAHHGGEAVPSSPVPNGVTPASISGRSSPAFTSSLPILRQRSLQLPPQRVSQSVPKWLFLQNRPAEPTEPTSLFPARSGACRLRTIRRLKGGFVVVVLAACVWSLPSAGASQSSSSSSSPALPRVVRSEDKLSHFSRLAMAGGKDSAMGDVVSEDWSQLTPDILREVPRKGFRFWDPGSRVSG